jgi:hypothetical protein
VDPTSDVTPPDLRRILRKLRWDRFVRAVAYVGSASFAPDVVALIPDPIDLELMDLTAPAPKEQPQQNLVHPDEV